ncbi:MAG: hypothetical protein A3C43_05190 [Candidatus Schekmanbacteria bacterium RIFCSPHIGHO2_02_FULL_38_11]|uniref:Peptidase S49 domain-containing protein n=1 Tax=Candidatus Schekmanbacteria bacterium RIFCSPLOWO2_12_FULL_38_15 TaxID=1817883 RepID=A0A1F7SCC8_9BACT|nr:MAG: hypothetical protein A2043_03345 [Candidatus Schekmanbacteria bacterium GWA2_38_9]OGL51436.1 MAG: hypothetical protein A3G31_06175 [Candidatus Schekmanbacteria bacterium RIFCSPLOWO2_12_FULL_38_15]OGL51557.1 MAG: hypothetical protein A3H37_09390 [Candidatus Schekmanbacteria bacterium RIFCSPLOWO2_02_FULL_38_14]OGL53182.1 MAG: hypothetical protein A3C43_05190 [Candidatus Schekmanbacteria bacterium RIFCSPHIGHO2_02_FULL_38_11]
MRKERVLTSIILILCILSVIIGALLLRKGVNEKDNEENSSGFFSRMPSKEGIAVVDIYGEISFQPTSIPFGVRFRGADAVVDRIRTCAKNPRVKAIILRINSPGGTVGATQEIYDEVKKARKKGIKVVASFGDIAASGAYYIACGADKIVANRGTITGSVGVYIGSLNIKDFMDKYGIKYNIVKSGQYKDILSVWKELSKEEKEILQDTVDNVYSQFLGAVSEGRHISPEEVKRFADGRIFSGEQAKKIKFVDELGGFEDAKLIAGKLAGIKGEPLIIKEPVKPLEQIFELLSNMANLKTNPFQIEQESPVKYQYLPQFAYINDLERMFSPVR